ncbi:MAG TPA: BON domain-containing protein [Candidatus Angelobacter sp.]
MKRVLFWTLAGVMTLTLAAAAGASPLTDDQQAENRIYRSVRHELVMLPQLTVFDNLSYKVEDGTVTLYGQVRNPVLKDEAASVVKKIEGVESVNNRIEILPASFNDDRIRRREARAIFGYDSLFRYSLGVVPPIHIIVKNGHVTLEGMVTTQADKNVAGIRANGVPGVFSVENNLQVENSDTGK